MKIIIKYEDWLLQTRNKVEPKQGDKIKTITAARGNQDLQGEGFWHKSGYYGDRYAFRY